MSYRLHEAPPSPTKYLTLCEAGDGRPDGRVAAWRGLLNSVYAITLHEKTTNDLVGIGRLVNDDGCFYQPVDIAVYPDHQRRGLGTRIVSSLMDCVEETASLSAYVILTSDVGGFYEQFGFKEADRELKGCSFAWATCSGVGQDTMETRG